MIFKYSGTQLPVGFFIKSGDYCVETGKGFVIVRTGDYIITYDGEVKVINQDEYENSIQLKRLVVQEVSIALLEDLIQAFEDLAVSDTVKIDLLRTIGPSTDMIIGNKISAARRIANAIPTTANFTAPRKNGLLALIDDAIAKL